MTLNPQALTIRAAREVRRTVGRDQAPVDAVGGLGGNDDDIGGFAVALSRRESIESGVERPREHSLALYQLRGDPA